MLKKITEFNTKHDEKEYDKFQFDTLRDELYTILCDELTTDFKLEEKDDEIIFYNNDWKFEMQFYKENNTYKDIYVYLLEEPLHENAKYPTLSDFRKEVI